MTDKTEDEGPGIGHNSGLDSAVFRRLIERIENLEDEKADIQTDIRQIFTEAKARGFHPKIMRQVLKMRKQDRNQLNEEIELLRLYLASVDIEI